MNNVLSVSLNSSEVLTFVWCPPGYYIQPATGTSLYEKMCAESVKVVFTKGFWLSQTPITFGQWVTIEKDDLNEFTRKKMKFPLVAIDYREFMSFLDKINALDLLPRELQGCKFMLPNYLQSRYACFSKVQPDLPDYWNKDNFGEYAWYIGNSNHLIHEGGLKKPTPWGLYDVFGNVAELSCDVIAEKGQVELVDPVGTFDGTDFFDSVGGSYISDYDDCIRMDNGILGYSNQYMEEYGFRLTIQSPV